MTESIYKCPINALNNCYSKAAQHLENAKNYLGKNIQSANDICKKSLTNSITRIKTFIEKNYKVFFFTMLSLFAYEFAFSRFAVSAIITLALENKFKQPTGPIMTSNKLALSTIGALGLLLHKITSPFSNPFFYLAPVLNGVAFSKAAYALYRSYFPIPQENPLN